MPDGFQHQVMLCWPSDRQEIAQLAAAGATEAFIPTVEHSLSTCDACSRSIWIGPQQLQLVKSVFVSTKKLCMFCVSEAQRALHLQPREVDVGLNLRDAPRRVT
jgi:hypothetical protein